MHPNDTPKLCECGCGQSAPIAKLTDVRKGYIKGQPTRFVPGHNSRIANPSKPTPREKRFWKYVTPNGPDDCWLWQGPMMPNGYGRLKIAGHTVNAHRLSWQIHFGEIPNGLFVCHKCDVKNCVNPSHLFLGSPKDNTQDMNEKGRRRDKHGEDNGNHKIDEADVLAIRQLSAQGFTQREIGERFGIGQTQVHRIVHGQRWKHVT